MSQQLIPQIVALFLAAGYVVIAVIACVDIYKYAAVAVETRSIFHTRTRMWGPLVALVAFPGVALRYLDVPKSVAIGLEAVSGLALLVVIVLGWLILVRLFRRLLTAIRRNR